MEALNEAVLAAVQNQPNIDDYGQRAALGMARMWMEHGRIERDVNPADKYTSRDDLAEALVEIIRGHAREDQKEALAYARAVVNEPFRDPKMNGQREKMGILRPGEAAKAVRPDPFAR